MNKLTGFYVVTKKLISNVEIVLKKEKNVKKNMSKHENDKKELFLFHKM